MIRSYPFGEPAGLELDPAYATLRRTEPVCRVRFRYGGEGWLVTSYELIKKVVTDPQFSRAAAAGRDVPRMFPQPLPPGVLPSLDPPEHARLRRLLSATFTARQVQRLQPGVQVLADALLDQLQPPADLMTGFVQPLPLVVICELLGVPVQDRHLFGGWVQTLTAFDAHTAQEAADSRTQMREYFTELIERHRRQPADDLLSALITATDDDGKLSEKELVMLASTLLTGGYETTTNQLGCSIYLLLCHPEQLAALRADPELIEPAVEELLRFVPLGVGAGFTWIATEEVRLGDVTIAAGDAVLYSMSAGNRDETVFDNPERFDVTRQPQQHLAFSYGVHFCVGAQLARMELRIALATLLRRCDALELTGPVTFERGQAMRKPEKLNVCWQSVRNPSPDRADPAPTHP